MNYRTINLPFLIKGDVANKIIFTARMYRSAVICGFERIRKLGYYPTRREIDSRCYELAKKFTGCSYYANAICRDIYEIVQSCKELDVKLADVEFRNWLYFESRGDKRRGNFGIRLEGLDKVQVKLLVGYSEVKSYIVNARPPKSRRFRNILAEPLEIADKGLVNYNARVYINDYTVGVVRGVVQISIPEELWLNYTTRSLWTYSFEEIEYVLGSDVNSDNIAFCLIDLDGNIIEVGKIVFSKYRAQGVKTKGCRGYIIQELHKLLHRLKDIEGKKILVAVEQYEVLSKLKLVWIKSGERRGKHWNYWVSFFKPRTVKDIIQVCNQHKIPVIEVDPRGTTHSEEHDIIARKFGLDKHLASAYLIAKRALDKLREHIKTYTSI